MINQQLHYGELQIPYKVFFIPHRTNKIGIHVHPNGSVQINAPTNTSLTEIKKAASKRARWIHKHISYFEEQRMYVLPREYVSGESHFYLGKRFVLKIKVVKSKPPLVKLWRGQLQVITDNKNTKIVKGLLWEWYKTHAYEVFDRRLDEIWKNLNWIKKKPDWKLLTMKKQWGSCSPKGLLSLNPHLIKAPRECIDYVIMHELCHLKIHNHSKYYYKLLEKTIPGWESVKGRLDGMAELLLAS